MGQVTPPISLLLWTMMLLIRIHLAITLMRPLKVRIRVRGRGGAVIRILLPISVVEAADHLVGLDLDQDMDMDPDPDMERDKCCMQSFR